ncbi:MAG: hypothetical protein OEP45_05335 [Acidobacteriota bacterium]|nr:hypothetical protein [Acidobacteriota bacterium]
MTEDAERAVRDDDEEDALASLGHPRGTLAIVIVYAILFALGWVALYVFEFLPRGAPR